MKQCYVTGYTVIDASIRNCPHPSVISRYGRNGKCQVCYMVCRKCRFARKDSMSGGVFCDYGKQA